MGATRSVPATAEGTKRFPLERGRGRLAIALDQGEVASAVSRALAELAAAHECPLVVIASRPRLASSLRSARLLGMEPRVVAPAGQPGLPARLTLSLAMRGSGGPSARASAVAFVASFAADQATAPAKLADAVGRATSRLGNAFSFEALSAELGRMPATTGTAVAARLAALHEAEQHAAVFATPVPWSRLLAPSPRGRPAAVWVDTSSMAPGAAEVVGGLALSALAATVPEWSAAVGGKPPVLLAQGVRGPLAAFALGRLLGPHPPAPLFGLFVEDSSEPGDALALPDVPAAFATGGGLVFEGIDGPLPLPDVEGPSEPLTATERESLTPLTLRTRIVGSDADEEMDPDREGRGGPSPGGSARGRAPGEAVQTASGDLDHLVRSGVKPGKRRATARRGEYEAGDFDLG